MAQEAVFARGDVRFMEYTPSGGAVVAGQVVLLGNTAGITCGVAHQDIPNGVQGVVGVGGGRYKVLNNANIAAWTKVWWDDAANKLTTTSTNNALFGFTLEAGNNAVVEALHFPLV
jgi:hypothetical protein